MKIGVLFQPGALWVGIHYSAAEKRYCINFVPFFTIWITEPGGKIPRQLRGG